MAQPTGAAAETGLADRHAVLYGVFTALDADGSEYVDAQEFKSLFSDVGEKHSDARMAEIDSVRGRGDVDGRLTADEFCAFWLEYFAALSDTAFKEKIAVWEQRIAESYRKLLLRRVFARMDVDKSGGVSLEEFKALASEMDIGTDASTAYFKWIEGAVGNSDGVLTSDEWVPFVLETEAETSDEDFEAMVREWMRILEMKKRVTILRQLFLKMDADCSGEVDASEFANLRDFEAGETEGQLAFIYDYLDTAFGNSDGVLSMSEWTVGMKDACAHLADADFEAEMAKLSTLLTNNQRNLWRSIFCRSHANTFVTAARAAGATHALFIQHANCHEAEGDDAATRSLGSALGLEMGDASALRESDGAIRLTNRGSAQCMVARDEWFGRLPVRPVVLCSPAKRTIETAMHMSGLAAAPPLVEIESMHPVGVHQTCEEIFVQKGRAGPLRAFLDVEGGETAFSSYAESVCEELAAKFREQGGGRRGGDTYVSMFGHPVFVHAAAYAVACASGMGVDALDAMLDVSLGEAEGILIPLYGASKKAIHLKRPL